MPPLEEVAAYFALAERDRWFSNSGPCHRLLTERLERFIGRDAHCLLVSNGTLGLIVALRALTSRRPSTATEVLVPSFTFVATINAIVWAGLTPVFVDIDPGHWHPSADGIEHALASRAGRVAAVLSCSTFGTPPPPAIRARWRKACAEHRVPLLIDSAAGFGARDESGDPLGLQGDAELFSFHATKPFAIGEGGMLTTLDRELFDEMARLINFGIDEHRVLTGEAGLNAKLSELHAATGLAVFDRYGAILEGRQQRAKTFKRELEPEGFEFQLGSERSTWQFVPTLAPSSGRRDEIVQEALLHGIEVRTYFTPCHRFAPCAGFPRIGSLEVTEDVADRMLSLPMSNDLSDDEVAQITRSCLVATRA
jgi:dTDP-4-amino-4,6-dideoxygalactose transaminase